MKPRAYIAIVEEPHEIEEPEILTALNTLTTPSEMMAEQERLKEQGKGKGSIGKGKGCGATRPSCATCNGGCDAMRQSHAITATPGKGYGTTRSSGVTGTARKGCDMSRHMIVVNEDSVTLEPPIVTTDGTEAQHL